MTKIVSRRWDPAEGLDSEEEVAAYLSAALEDGDPRVVNAALGNIARARGMTEIARETGLAREALYRSLRFEGNPEFATIMKVSRALGVKLHAEPAEKTKTTTAEKEEESV